MLTEGIRHEDSANRLVFGEPQVVSIAERLIFFPLLGEHRSILQWQASQSLEASNGTQSGLRFMSTRTSCSGHGKLFIIHAQGSIAQAGVDVGCNQVGIGREDLLRRAMVGVDDKTDAIQAVACIRFVEQSRCAAKWFGSGLS